VVTDPHAYDWQGDDKTIFDSVPKRASGQQGSKLSIHYQGIVDFLPHR